MVLKYGILIVILATIGGLAPGAALFGAESRLAREPDESQLVELCGAPAKIGETWGTVNRSAVCNAMEQYLAKARAKNVSEATLIERSRPFVEIAQRIARHWIDEARAIARAAGIDADLYVSMLANAPRDIGFHECIASSISGMTVEIDPEHPHVLTCAWFSLPAKSLSFPVFMGGRKTPRCLVNGDLYKAGKSLAADSSRWEVLEVAFFRNFSVARSS